MNNPIRSFDEVHSSALKALLDTPTRSTESFSFYRCASFFIFACTPELIQASELLPIVLGDEYPAGSGIEDHTEVESVHEEIEQRT